MSKTQTEADTEKAQLEAKIKLLLAENHALRQQLGATMLATNFIMQHAQEIVGVCGQLETRLVEGQQNGNK